MAGRVHQRVGGAIVTERGFIGDVVCDAVAVIIPAITDFGADFFDDVAPHFSIDARILTGTAGVVRTSAGLPDLWVCFGEGYQVIIDASVAVVVDAVANILARREDFTNTTSLPGFVAFVDTRMAHAFALSAIRPGVAR
jgi:hypothetical protein